MMCARVGRLIKAQHHMRATEFLSWVEIGGHGAFRLLEQVGAKKKKGKDKSLPNIGNYLYYQSRSKKQCFIKLSYTLNDPHTDS